MCVEHAALIDISETLSLYPAERLRQWKQKQLEDYDRVRQGWILDTEMAKRAIAESVSRADVLISHSNVSLGGGGGKALGAGGGGGGAIGRNARGGHGGKGGQQRIDDGDYTLPWLEDAPKRLEPNELVELGIDFVPGAGGAGAGAIGDGAIGGEGGDGGDHVSALIDITRLRHAGLHHVECIVGRGGENGGDGGDTIMNFVTENGGVLKSIRISGGKGGGTNVPQDCTEIGPSDIESNFRATALLTANAIEGREGLFYMLGADWITYAVPGLPFDAVWPVVYSLRWKPYQWSQPRAIFLSLLRPDGSRATSQPFTIAKEIGLSGDFRGFHAVSANLDVEGTWLLQLHSGGFVLAQLPITVTMTTSRQRPSSD
jgi:hypothetical protein